MKDILRYLALLSAALAFPLASGLCADETKAADPLRAQFQNPPAAARPWVFWFWNNGNVTEKGIEADLAAMKQVGIGGATIMDLSTEFTKFAPPAGDADYMSPRWQSLMKFALATARREGLEINVTNGPGWCGSSGAWITPETAMQTLVSTTTEVAGGAAPVTLPQPPGKSDVDASWASKVDYSPFYRDIAVLAFPKKDGVVTRDEVLDLTKFMDPSGRLNHPLPEGKWLVQRIGHAPTGATTKPPVKGGNGLEADKYSEEAITLQFNKVVGALAKALPVSKDGGLVATHVDSWEVGPQSWTAKFAEEFKKRRGYDLTKYLPNVVEPLFYAHVGGSPVAVNPPEHPVGSPEEVKRFRWDFYQTCSELLSEKYIGTLVRLSHANGLRFSMEGYTLALGDEAEYTALSDEPMTEFWAMGDNYDRKAHEMASVAHTMGRKVVGAEAFTADDADKWMLHPALLKAKGDQQFAEGVNRFVIHRYAMQPYLDRFPGATMGPWGIHYERTNTWWPMLGAWHEYLSRCQFLLRQGLYVADALYLRHQRPNQQTFDQNPPLPEGYHSDDISAERLISRAQVKNCRIVLPDGMNYALLVVPDSPMTPELVRKIRDLVQQGATVYGPRPTTSPSLTDYPDCDKAVASMAGETWGDCDGTKVTGHAFGKGRVVCGTPLETVLAGLTGGSDLQSSPKLNWIHRTMDGREIYFVTNPNEYPVIADAEFRVKGMAPQWWDPLTGEAKTLARVAATGRGVRVKLPLTGGQSGFVVFEPETSPRDYVASVTRNGEAVGDTLKAPEISIVSASYGPAGDAARTIDAKALVEAQIRGGKTNFSVGALAQPNDPAPGAIKTLHAAATINGRPFEWSGVDTDRISFFSGADFPDSRTTVWSTDRPDTFVLSSKDGGEFRLTSASGKKAAVTLPEGRKVKLPGPWTVKFPPKWGAPDEIRMDRLASLSESNIEGVRHFSGICAYETTFDLPAPAEGPGATRYWLDLGDLEVMGVVTLNGKKIGTVWDRPARIEVTNAMKPGSNKLVVEVANTWQNRMIGDAALPKSQRYTWSSWEPFTPGSPLPKSGLIGPVTVESQRDVEVKLE